MANDSKTLEDRLIEFGISLTSLPSSVDQLYSLLEKIDSLLSNVEQSPSQSILSALKPIMKELPVKELLRHPDIDVKAAVASCLSEITRITAPEAPFDDDIMKDIFQMIVGAFGMLGDMSSRAFEKRVSVLETVAKVRFCVVMLDLECDALILEMFHHFVKVVRPEHPENVPTSMETIMSVVIEESEDISQEILSCLLSTAKEDNQDVLPVARDLVKKVMGKCHDKLKPSFLELVQSPGAPLSKYIEVVESIYEEVDSKTLGHNEPNEPHGPDEAVAEVSRGRTVSEVLTQAEDSRGRTVSEVLTQVSGKLEQEVGCTEKNDTAADISSAAATSHVNSQMGNGDSMEQPSSPKQNSDESCRHEQLNVVNEQIDNDNSELTAVKSDCYPPVQLTDTPDHSQVDSDKDASPLSKEASSLQVDDATANDVQPATSLEPEKKNELEHILKSDNAAAAVASPVSTESPVNSVRTKRGRPPSSKVAENQREVKAAEEPASASVEKDSLPNSKAVVTKDYDYKKEPDVAPTSVANDSELKPQRNSVKKRGLKRKSIWKDSSGRKQKSRLKQQKKANSLGKEAAGEQSLEGVDSSPRSASDVPGIDDSHLEDTSKTKSRRKSPAELDDMSKAHDRKKELGEILVGSKIRVFWPDDAKFYDGMVDSYDRKNKKHRIVYIDGDVEDLVLKDEQWELVESSTKKRGGKQKGQRDASQNSRTKREKPTSDALSKQEKLQTQSKRSKDAVKRKGGARTGVSTGEKLSYDDSPSTPKKTKRKSGRNIKVKTPKSRSKNEDVPESETEEDTPETTSSKEEPGTSKDKTKEHGGKTRNEISKTGSKSRHSKKSNKKGNQNSSSLKDDTPLKGFLTRISKESTPKTASRVEEDNLVAKNRNERTSGGSGANGISSSKEKGKGKAGESESTTGVDDSEVKIGGTGGRKRKRRGGRK